MAPTKSEIQAALDKLSSAIGVVQEDLRNWNSVDEDVALEHMNVVVYQHRRALELIRQRRMHLHDLDQALARAQA